MRIFLVLFVSLCLANSTSIADSLSSDVSKSSASQVESLDLFVDENATSSIFDFADGNDLISFQGQCTDDDDCGTWKCCNTSCENVVVCKITQ